MQKNSGDILTVEVDPVTDEYTLQLPEWVVNDLGWYEGTKLRLDIDGGDVILTEQKEIS